MKIYADVRALRVRQIVTDLAVAVLIIVWVLAGLGVYDAVDQLTAAGDTTEDAGGELAARMAGIANLIDDLPIVGEELERPFLGAAGAGENLRDAGAAASDTLHTIAVWLGTLIAAVPILWLSSRYFPKRIQWIRDATSASRLDLADADVIGLLAMRAAGTHSLAATAPFAGDDRALAGLELRRLGIAA